MIKQIENEGPELDIIRVLFREYAGELQEDLCFQSFEAEVQDPLKKYVHPGGCILLAYINEDPAGCIALMPLPSEEGLRTCEMKRLYVRAPHRKSGLGQELVERLLALAQEKSFKKMKLDTLQRLQPAIKLYERYGFTQTKPYNFNPISDVVYMEKALQ